jgi:hypothetical protein
LSITSAGYVFTEHVSITSVPGLIPSFTRSITSEKLEMATQKKMTSQERSVCSSTIVTPSMGSF